MKNFVFSLFFLLCSLNAVGSTHTIDLSGIWRFQLDPLGFGKTPGSELYLSKLAETIVLPGTTDTGGKGIKNNARYIDRLSRKFEYQGMAWYQREVVVPQDWSGNHITLNLERCHWETTVYVDGQWVGTDERLSTPNVFDLTDLLTPGVHTLTICVDNRLKYPMDAWDHGTTEYTQTNWNGIVGDISLNAYPRVHLSQINIYPNIANNSVKARVTAQGLRGDERATLSITIKDDKGSTIASSQQEADSATASRGMDLSLSMGKSVKLWDEFSPYLYTMQTTLEANGKRETRTTTFGMRSVEQGAHHIRLNNHDIHLRGVLDCAAFPKTGYPSTNVSDWARIMSTIKSYGMNHVRFHSWCPPEAAFEAADQVGMYLQVELPMWIKNVGKYPARRDFFEHEMYAVLNQYGNHPSFILMCNGNENEGDFSVLEDLVKKAQAHDNRHLYSASTARTHVGADQYYVSHVTQKGGITVYEGIPSTDWDKNETSSIDVPVIAHETGQRCMYPNFNEISKYNGVLEARNMEVFRERLARNGMLQQADDFFHATGAHTVLQYKEVNESLLRTRNSGGFQLLGLADFPGQGSAYVGVLDPFWESKGLVTPQRFSESCGPTVLLARFPKRTYSPSETFTARMDIYNFSPHQISGTPLLWKLIDPQGNAIATGKLKTHGIGNYMVDSLGQISAPLSAVHKASKYTLSASLGNIHNQWDIWVYPETNQDPTPTVTIAYQWNDSIKQQLIAGNDILLMPTTQGGRKTYFASHFWNPIMFKWDPLIVGTLIDANHPAFTDFPTDSYADWQWWDILNNAYALELDMLHNVTPFIQSIDSYETNHKLGIAFEARMGKGRLIVAAINSKKNIQQRPATRQLIHSLQNYMLSDKFNPQTTLQPYQLDELFDTSKPQQQTNSSDAATKQLLNN